MSLTEPPRRVDEARPLILVAERESPVEDGLGLMDVAVMVYRVRWKFVGVWVLCAAVFALVAPARAPFEARMEIDAPAGGLEGIAILANEWPDLSCDFARITVNGKQEVLRTHLFISMPTRSESEVPDALRELKSATEAWIAEQIERYRERQADAVRLTRERLNALSQDNASTAIESRAAVALAVAQAESALKFPPAYKITGIEVRPARPLGLRDWMTRAAGSFMAAAAIVFCLELWSRVRLAARSGVSR